MRIFLTGGHGFLGTHVAALLRSQGHEVTAPTHEDCDLLDFCDGDFPLAMEECNPEAVIHLAGRVGGIGLNRAEPATLWRQNILMGANVLSVCAEPSIRKLVMVGTTCFPKGTAVRMADGSYLPIEQMRTGQVVVTASGHRGRVNRVMHKAYSGHFISLIMKGRESISCTPEHPFLTARGWVPAGEIKKGDQLVHPATLLERHSQESIGKVQLLKAEDLRQFCKYRALRKSGYSVAVLRGVNARSADGQTIKRWARGQGAPRLIKNLPHFHVPVNGDLAWLCGIFTADGYIPSNRIAHGRGARNQIGFAVGYDADLAEKITDAFEAIWGVRPRIDLRRTGYVVTISHRIACDTLERCYLGDGRGAGFKRIPEFIMGASPKAKRDFLEGYWAGDGHFRRGLAGSKRRADRALAVACSISRCLMLQVRDLLLELGIWSAIYRRKAVDTVIENRPVKCQPSWTVRLNGGNASRLIALFEADQTPRFGETRWFVEVREILSKTGEMEVYNLSVDGEETYIADGIAVHNCSYPRVPKSIPFVEEELFDGYPEETNAAYGIAKRALIVGAEAYRREFGLNVTTVIPTNLYGPGDNCDPDTSHVIPAIIRKMLDAKEANQQSIMLWGTGQATRDFLHVRDAARGIAGALTIDDPGPINLGSGCEIPIANLVEEIAEAVGYRGHWFYDQTKPDGQARRVLDISKARDVLGWEPEIDFTAGLKETVEWMRSQVPA